jgi:hypothetical protein
MLNAFVHAGVQPNLMPRSRDMHFYSSKTVFVGPGSTGNPGPLGNKAKDNNTLHAAGSVPDICDVSFDNELFYQLPPHLEELFHIEMNSPSSEQSFNVSRFANLSVVSSLHLQ